MEHSEQQNPQRQQGLVQAAGSAPVPEGGGEEETAGGDPQQC